MKEEYDELHTLFGTKGVFLSSSVQGGVQAEVQGGVQAEVQGGVQAEVQAEVQGDVQAKVQGDVQAKVQAEVQGDVQGGVQAEELRHLRVVSKKVILQEQHSDSKDLKKWQKEQEQKKLAELTAKGIDPHTLLTVENLRKWILEDSKTFAYVSREYLGLPEAKVAEFGNKHDIKSKITQKRAVIAATQRAQQIRS